ncbi:MAG: AAA family ATPase [Gammaproteobacteria bacterium]|nr:AAA family ATPase [Gammaproteobacteria bacterium]
MHIEKIAIQNFKALKSVELTDLPPVSVFVGKNGTGKSTLFKVFSFLKTCLESDVRQALTKEGGLLGFKEVITRGASPNEEICIELKFRMEITGVQRLVTYILNIGRQRNKPVVNREILRYKRGESGAPFHFIDFKCGRGEAVNNEEDFNKPDKDLTRESQTISEHALAISSLGQLERFKAAKAFRDLIANWHISDFHIGDARGKKLQESGVHLSSSGDNLPSVAYRLREEEREVFECILDKMRTRVPGITDIEAKVGDDGGLLMRYSDGAFSDPFLDHNVSDGTIKMFAYMVLLHDPMPHKILCVEEPENQLYPELMTLLAEEFQGYAERGGQVFISTHSPDFLDAVELESLFLIEKKDGVSKILRAADDPLVREQMEAGFKAGQLWNEGLFEGMGERIGLAL